MPNHIVLAYSGGLDTSVGIHWLARHHNARVTAVLVDVGQPLPSLTDAVERALHNGAVDCKVIDAKADFAADYVAPAIRANALYQGIYPLATALARPLMAKILVDVARQVGADAVAHGCTGKGNDQVRFETAIHALAPDLLCLSPQRTHPMDREAVLDYAARHDLRLPPRKSSPFSVDENLYGRSVEGNELEDPADAVPEAAYAWTTSPQAAPDTPGVFTLDFEAGLPVALDGVCLPLHTLITQLQAVAGAHGVGRIDHVEDRLVGIKSREVYEAPAAVAILGAKKALEALTLSKDEATLKPYLEQTFAQHTYDGKWYSPAMAAMNAFFQAVQQHVTGSVTMRAYKGGLTVLSRTSPVSLYDTALATYGRDDAFRHDAATGFIHLWSLPLETVQRVRGATQAPTSTPAAPANPPAPQDPLVAP